MRTPTLSDIEAINSIAAIPAILDIVCRTTGMGFAAVARVTEDRWIACSVKDDIQFGLRPGGELKLETTICNEIRQSRKPVIIDHVLEDAQYSNHATPAMYGFQSYISMPIILRDGAFFGTLCAIDPNPARLKNPETIAIFEVFADLLGRQLSEVERALSQAADLRAAQDRLAESAAALAEERSMAALREEFVAILGHDLRNPLAAIQSGIRLLHRTPLNERALSVLTMMQRSSLRIGELIANMLDFAKIRLGGGMVVQRVRDVDLAQVVGQIVDELRASWPERTIRIRTDLTETVSFDPDRIGQLCSNLLSNALLHGEADSPICLELRAADGVFELSVINHGAPIPEAALTHLFKPFSRKSDGQQQGLGLGLHITAEIARAHGGGMSVASTPAETRFTLRMPTEPGQIDEAR